MLLQAVSIRKRISSPNSPDMSKAITVLYTATARKDLKACDIRTASRIVTTIQRYTQEDPLAKAKPLQGPLHGMYRYRIGDYRAIFEYDTKDTLTLLTILRIKHRKDAYK